MSTIYVAERHDQVLSLWREQQSSALKILHLDFHCDMRGLLIDRNLQKAYRIWDMVTPNVDQGNFLAHAILEGRLLGVRWVHDEPGGRQFDVGTVNYESDFTALPKRIYNFVSLNKGIPLQYEVIPYAEWEGLKDGECLDIDWDFFASKEYPENSIEDRINSFLNSDFNVVPLQVYICYSPDYSHPSRELFEYFIRNLARIFRANIVELPSDQNNKVINGGYRGIVPSFLRQQLRRFYYSAIIGLRKRGIY